MADTRQEAAADAGTACVHYLLRASIRSARLLQLYEQLLGCVSRGQLQPHAARDSMSHLLRTRAGEQTAKLADLTARWLDQVVQSAALTSEEDVEAMLAGSARPLPQRLPQIGSLWFELLDDLSELRGRFVEEILAGTLSGVRPKGLDAPFAVELQATRGATASACLSLANTRSEPAAIRCAVTDVRRADGVGPAFVPKVTIAPGRLQLQPAEEIDLRLSLRLDAEVFDAGVPYVGAVRVNRRGEPPFDVPLRIVAAKEET